MNRFLAFFFVLIFALSPLLGACRGKPAAAPQQAAVSQAAPAGQPSAAQPSAATGATTATSSAGTSASPTQAPTLVPSPAPTRAPLPPVVVRVTPEAGAELPVNQPLKIDFDQPMDPATTSKAFKIEPTVPGQVTVQGQQLVFAPAGGFQRAAEYRVTLDSSAASAHGLKLLQPVSLKINTAGYFQVAGSQPGNGTRDVPVDTKIVVSFNHPVVPLTGVSQQVALPQPLVITPTIAGKGEWLSTSIYQLAPDGGLAASTLYTATVKSGLESTTGALLEKPYTFTFTTTRPTITGWLPENPLAAKIEKPISVTFSMPMDRPSTEAAFSLTGSDGRAIAGTFGWNERATQMGFQPAQRLDFGHRYTAKVAASARATGGTPGQSTGTLESEGVFIFSTVPLPTVVRSEPTPNKQNADPYGSVMFQFGGPMDPATFVSGTVTILPRPTQVYTGYQEVENMFFVTFERQASTAYTVTLSGKVADPYGNKLGQDYLLHFRTRDFDPSLQLNSSAPIGTYNAYTPTEAVASYLNVPVLQFGLYKVPADRFLKLTGRDFWQEWTGFRPSNTDLIRRWEVTTPAARNVPGVIRTRLTGQDGKDVAPGLYYLEGSTRNTTNFIQQGQIIARTDLNLTLKTNETSALAWVTDLKSGLPVSGVSVGFADGDKVNATAITDRDGLVEITFPRRERPWEPIMATATGPGGKFGVASSSWEDGISPWNFNLGGGVTASPYMGYVYTDRPIYRPGQTVYWKAIVRRDDDARYSLPEPGQSISITVRDDQGNKVLEQRLPLSPMGTVDGKLALGAEAGLGFYNISVELAKDVQFGGGFQVAEYRKPEYQLTAATDKPEYIQGQTITASVSASYFFGGPVKNGKVRWVVLSNPYTFEYKPPKGEETSGRYFTFGDWDWFDAQNNPPFGGRVTEGTGTTDASGTFTVTLPANIQKYPQSQRFTIDFTITDVNNQSVSTQASALVHKGDFYIGMHPQSYVADAGKTNAVDIITVDTKSQPVPGTRLTVVANRVEWFSVREQSDDGRYYWTSRAKKTPFYTETLTTRSDGSAVFNWKPDEAGEYKIEASGRDQTGHLVQGAAFIWASSSGEYAYWRQENNDRIQVIADKDEYRPGDTAQLLVASPYQGTVKALRTIERNGVLSHEVIDLTGNSEVLSVPILAEHAPNVFVSLMLVKGIDAANPTPSFKMGLVQLKVSVSDKQLQVLVRPDRDTVAPRDTITYHVETHKADGKPAANTEVSLALVDKAILTLASDPSGTLMDRFYSQRALGVRTASSLVVNVDRVVAQLSRGAAKGGGGGGSSEALSVRREFPDIAYWNASVTTGKDGTAEVAVKLPDNLTTWSMDARAVTADTLVGQTKNEIVATKDLLVRPVLPRFFIQGDQAEIAAVVHNNTAQALDVSVGMQATGLQLVGGSGLDRATVPAKGTYKAVWPVKVEPAVGEASLLEDVKVQFRATSGSNNGLQDGVEMTLPVYRYTAPETTGTSGQVGPDEQRLELVRLPADADPARGELDVQIEPSLAAGMLGGLTYLQHYPYECTEQTVSRFLPNVVTYQALKSLGISRPDLAENLPEQVGTGLQRIYARQHVDGGWGWWVQDQSNPALTSYVLFGLAKASKAGFAVDQEVMRRAERYLERTLKAPAGLKPYQLNEQAFTIYALALAGDPQPNRAGALYEERDRLSIYAKGYLALAFGIINDEASPARIKTLLADISGKAITSATTTHWEEGWTDYWNMNSDTRTTSIVVDALSILDPKNVLAPNAVRWLMLARKADRWETTQENAWAIMGLTDWMAATRELEGNYNWQVTLNEATLGKGTVTPDTVKDVTQLRADISRLLADETNSVLIERSADPSQTGKGQLYYTMHLKTYLPVDQIKPLSKGLTVSRQYQVTDCGEGTAKQPGQAAEPTENTCPPVSQARVGDTLNVKLTIVVPNTLYYVVVEDPLPAGAEAIDTSLKTTSQAAQGPNVQQQKPDAKPGAAKPWYPYWWWTPTHVDLRDEKAVLFATQLEPGTYEFNYQVQATLPGEYLTLPPTAYAMYYPEVQARGAGSVFTVTEP